MMKTLEMLILEIIMNYKNWEYYCNRRSRKTAAKMLEEGRGHANNTGRA